MAPLQGETQCHTVRCMYEFYYANFSAPAGWLLLMSLLAMLVCHTMVLYLETKIDNAVKTARAEVHDVITSHIAIKEREQLEIWRSGRKICTFIIPLLLAAWLVGLGRP